MKLLIRTITGEVIEFDVLPGDTFGDLSQRLRELGKVEINFNQLSKHDRSLEMSANVMEYISAKSIHTSCSSVRKIDSDNQNDKKRDIKNDAEHIESSSDANSSNENIEVFSSDLSLSDVMKSNITSDSLIGSANEFESEKNGTKSHKNDIKDVGGKRGKVVCRLCAQTTNSSSIKYLFDDPPDGEIMTLAEKINYCLPLYVTQEDALPKQVCFECLPQLESNYKFARMVSKSADLLEVMDFNTFSSEEDLDCPLCEGHMLCNATTEIEELPAFPEINIIDVQTIDTRKSGVHQIQKSLSEDFTETSHTENTEKSLIEEVEEMNLELTEYNTIDNFSTDVRKKRGRPKKIIEKKADHDDDKDWSAKDELKPIKKRGRPKGSKNKTQVVPKVTEVDCIICDQSFPDIPSVLAHTLLSHCEDGSDALPCPLCNTVWPDEGELVYHVNNHTTFHQVIISPCMLCPKAYKVKEELEQHLFEHLDQDTCIFLSCQCALCKQQFSTLTDMTAHLSDSHAVDAYNPWMCSYCSSRFSKKEEYVHHFQTVHTPPFNPKYACPKCSTTETSKICLVRHLVAEHCSEYVIERPLTYKCPACYSKFKSQYSLIKHPCTGVGNKFYCEDCNISFPIKARYVLHLQFHNEAQIFEMLCDVCLAEFTEEDSFYDHIRFQHETEENLECSKCNKIFKNNNSLSLHLRRHQEIRNHKCEICDKTFMNAQTLREHKVSHMKVKPYQCKQCGQCLSRPSRLRLHLRSHSVQRSTNSMISYSCPECLQVFPNLERVQSHFEQHETKSTEANFLEVPIRQVLRCEFCDACYTTHDHLNQHRNTVHSKPDPASAFSCSICKAKFSSYARVATHKLTHGITTETLILNNDDDQNDDKKVLQSNNSSLVQFSVPQYFVCEICNKECLHYTYLNMHRKLCHHQSSPSHSCKDCSQMFPTAWALHYHRRKMHNSRSKLQKANNKSPKKERDSSDDDLYECPYCLRQYASPETLDIHMKRLHVHSSAKYAGYVCETCGKTFAFKGSWQSHCDSHNGIKRFHCKECEKRFTHKAGLTKHMKLHSPDRPFLCEYCGKKFRDRTERDNHIRAHTGERPFMCDICGRTFHTRAVWLDHSRIHQDIRPHHCDQCGQSFRRSFALKSHYLIHTGERPFECKICGKDFRLKQSLSTHIKKDHESVTDSSQNQTEEGRIVEMSEIIEDQIIDFQNYDEFVTESIICNNVGSKIISKSGMLSSYESEMETDQVVNLGEQNTEQDLFIEKSQSSLNTPPRLSKPESLEYSDIHFSDSCETKILKKTLNIPIIYNEEEELKKKKKLCDITQTLSNADLPIIQELCHVLDETTDPK